MHRGATALCVHRRRLDNAFVDQVGIISGQAGMCVVFGRSSTGSDATTPTCRLRRFRRSRAPCLRGTSETPVRRRRSGSTRPQLWV